MRANGTDLDKVGCSFYMFSGAVSNTICTTGVVATLTYNIPDVFNP